MGDDRHNRCDSRDECYDCCERECVRECRDRCYNDCYCDHGNNGGVSIIWLLIILYLLFCSGDNSGRGGLFGGLF